MPELELRAADDGGQAENRPLGLAMVKGIGFTSLALYCLPCLNLVQTPPQWSSGRQPSNFCMRNRRCLRNRSKRQAWNLLVGKIAIRWHVWSQSCHHPYSHYRCVLPAA